MSTTEDSKRFDRQALSPSPGPHIATRRPFASFLQRQKTSHPTRHVAGPQPRFRALNFLNLRHAIYTTNTIEALNRILRKTLKTRGPLPTDEARARAGSR